MLPELSPANGVLTPGAAGFLETDFASGRELESSMMQFRDGPEADATQTPSNTPERAPAGTSVVQAVYTIIGLDGAMLANRIRVASRFGGRWQRRR